MYTNSYPGVFCQSDSRPRADKQSLRVSTWVLLSMLGPDWRSLYGNHCWSALNSLVQGPSILNGTLGYPFYEDALLTRSEFRKQILYIKRNSLSNEQQAR